MAVKVPHLLIAASNAHRLRNNLANLLDAAALSAIDGEIARNARGLFSLAEHHFAFAQSTRNVHWRQKVSRYYYAAYHVRRAVCFFVEGNYSTDVSDHKKVGNFPVDFPNYATYSTRLVDLRTDRNLADYDHEAEPSDLLLSVGDVDVLVQELINDAKHFLSGKGLTI